MWPSSGSDGVFTDAVARRIGILKESGSGLVTEELLTLGSLPSPFSLSL
ncbi:BnaA02g07710D [Brassica napus]|uniref:(rape) hypothetical protein n=1 Tax=Brassica napus TaxID=3708 RepID=A0A078H5H7_BRANA|nr:unnamed protein product [Brassica napus]CDY32709.1 BnaA02g07710D [Brassica napus]